MTHHTFRAALLILACLMLPAQAPAPANPPAQPTRPAREAERLPADKSTRHEITVAGRTLRFTATAGSIRLTNAEGVAQADIAYTAFVLDGADPRTRPVTVAVNGGPGASSAWLDFGAVGPWRVPFGEGTLSPSAPPAVVDNAETWLDFTDLVFLDPPGTGWSRALNEEARKRAWSVGGDISMLAEVSRRWLEANRRLVSPKLVLGESYGGFRGPRLVRALQSEQGVGITGLVLVSPVLDFGGRAEFYDPIGWVTRLPSMVAGVRHATTRADLAEVEAYAAGDYLRDLWRGVSDGAATERIVAQLTQLLPGIDPALIRRRAGRLDVWTFLHELQRDAKRVASIYDSGIGSADPFPEAGFSQGMDPILEPMRAVLTSAAYAVYAERLGWRPEGRYEILSEPAFRQWDWGRGRSAPESLTALRRALALDPRLRVMVAHGITDLITPYFGSKILLDQVPDLGPAGRVQLQVYPGGHMFYSLDGSRTAFHRDAAALVTALTAGDAPAAGTPPQPPPPGPSPGTPPTPAAR